MQVQRPIPRRSNWPYLACGCGGILAGMALVAGVALLLLPALPGMALRFAGFSSKGSTNTVFNAVPPAPSVQVQNAVEPPQATINLGSYGAQDLPLENNAYEVAVGIGSSGAPLATVTFSESGLMDLCYQRADLCGNPNSQFRNARLDLRPGGGIIYADVYIPNFGVWQPMGVVLRLDASGRQFEVAGVDVGGVLYDLPPNEIGGRVAEVSRVGNEILNQLSLEASGGQYTLSEVQIDDTMLTLVMR